MSIVLWFGQARAGYDTTSIEHADGRGRGVGGVQASQQRGAPGPKWDAGRVL
ncbi:MAG TPA: hypothetical protein VK655_07620 [Solirubrobacteraceae bacterium]|nr:hypothetical protein [Solirubrobacteraceae bacterium]